MLPYIPIALVVIVVGFIVLVSARPAQFRVERSATFSAPASAVFPQINELRNWEVWSPWAKRDPNMKLSYDGPAAGAGAGYAWEGNNQVGSGRMTITESRPGELIRIRLEFLKPFKATNTAEFAFKADGGSTVVTWSMKGNNNFIGKIMGLFMNMDKMIGGDFESGLAGIKRVVESAGK